MKIIEEYKKLDKDEKEVIFMAVWGFLTMFTLFASYSNHYLSIAFWIMVGYYLYRILLFRKRIEEKEDKK